MGDMHFFYLIAIIVAIAGVSVGVFTPPIFLIIGTLVLVICYQYLVGGSSHISAGVGLLIMLCVEFLFFVWLSAFVKFVWSLAQ